MIELRQAGAENPSGAGVRCAVGYAGVMPADFHAHVDTIGRLLDRTAHVVQLPRADAERIVREALYMYPQTPAIKLVRPGSGAIVLRPSALPLSVLRDAVREYYVRLIPAATKLAKETGTPAESLVRGMSLLWRAPVGDHDGDLVVLVHADRRLELLVTEPQAIADSAPGWSGDEVTYVTNESLRHLAMLRREPLAAAFAKLAVLLGVEARQLETVHGFIATVFAHTRCYRLVTPHGAAALVYATPPT
jgi:hypothetical protein